MRRLIGLFKEYDIVEILTDDPNGRYKAGESGVIVSISEARDRQSAEIGIELDNATLSEGEDPLRWVVIEKFKVPPIKVVDIFFPDGTSGDTFNVWPDDRTYINIDLPRHIVE